LDLTARESQPTIADGTEHLYPDTGTVRVLGQPHSSAVAQRIGYLPEERGLYTKMKVIDLLTYMAAIKG